MFSQWVVAGEYPDRQSAMEHALVVLAMGGECHIRREGEAFHLLVEEEELPRLQVELDAFDAELREPKPTDGEQIESAWAAIAYTWLLVLAYYFQLEQPERALGAGAVSHEGLVGAGEWWRAITALTLHGDLGHLVSNLVFGSVFVWGLAAMLGVGLTGWAFVLSGALGNLVNNLMRFADPSTSIGASTAVFGLLGCLVAARMTRWVRTSSKWKWRELVLPLGGGLALLTFLGSDPVSLDGGVIDVTAHLWGFVAGLVVGPLLEIMPKSMRTGWRAWLLGGASVLVLVGAWGLALG